MGLAPIKQLLPKEFSIQCSAFTSHSLAHSKFISANALPLFGIKEKAIVSFETLPSIDGSPLSLL